MLTHHKVCSGWHMHSRTRMLVTKASPLYTIVAQSMILRLGMKTAKTFKYIKSSAPLLRYCVNRTGIRFNQNILTTSVSQTTSPTRYISTHRIGEPLLTLKILGILFGSPANPDMSDPTSGSSAPNRPRAVMETQTTTADTRDARMRKSLAMSLRFCILRRRW